MKFLKKWFSPQILAKLLNRRSKEKRDRQKNKIRGREIKPPRVSSNKGKVNILRGEKHFNFKKPCWCDSIFSPSIIPFKKPFPKSFRKFS
jgi:hypothetical protein